jgi:hypothetical protein
VTITDAMVSRAMEAYAGTGAPGSIAMRRALEAALASPAVEWDPEPDYLHKAREAASWRDLKSVTAYVLVDIAISLRALASREVPR